MTFTSVGPESFHDRRWCEVRADDRLHVVVRSCRSERKLKPQCETRSCPCCYSYVALSESACAFLCSWTHWSPRTLTLQSLQSKWFRLVTTATSRTGSLSLSVIMALFLTLTASVSTRSQPGSIQPFSTRWRRMTHTGCTTKKCGQVSSVAVLRGLVVPGAIATACRTTGANRPVTHVSLWDAARFVNWMHNGQPDGAQGPETTELGAYANIGDQETFTRVPGARYFIPSADEWYKAAYHNKEAGRASDYFDFPTSTNSVPGADITETTSPGNNANVNRVQLHIGAPYYRTEVGAYELSTSPYGTFDQGGNVWEWTETESVFSPRREIFGGSFFGFSSDTTAGRVSYEFPSHEYFDIGFRIASVPEPRSDVAFMCSCMVAVMWSKLKSWWRHRPFHHVAWHPGVANPTSGT